MERNKYIRVSEILGLFKDFSSIPPDVLQRKCDIGTEVHKAIDAYFENDFYPLDDAASGYFESFEHWKNEFKESEGSVALKEHRFYDDDEHITGAVDLLVNYTGSSTPFLIDFKTSYAVDNVFWPIQAGFYYMLAQKNGYDVSDEVTFVKLLKDGSEPKVVQYIMSSEFLNVCKSMKNIYFYLTKVKDFEILDA